MREEARKKGKGRKEGWIGKKRGREKKEEGRREGETEEG